MFSGAEDGGGREGDRERRAFLVPARGEAGGADGADADEARQPGCGGFFLSWRRRRTRIAAVTTGNTADYDRPSHQSIDQSLSQEIHAMELARQPQTPRQPQSKPDPTAYLPIDVDSLIISLLPSLTDRWALQLVSSRWRSATQHCLTPPLPLIANADLTLLNCFADDLHSLPLPMNSTIPHPLDHAVTCLGSHNSWLILAYDKWDPQGNLGLPHSHCFLVQPVKGTCHPLASPCSVDLEGFSGALDVTGSTERMTFYRPVKSCSLRMKKLVMYQSSSLGSSKVVGLASQSGVQHIVFSKLGMKSWCICSANFITVGSDVEILQDKVVVLGNNQEDLFQIDFGHSMSYFPVICEVKHSMAVDLPQLENTQRQLNLVRSGSELLLVARYFTMNWEQVTAVRVYKLDALTWTLENMDSLGDRSILLSLSCSQAIAAGQGHPKANHLYFLDEFCPNFFPAEEEQFSYRSQVYSMTDQRVDELLIGRSPSTHRPGFPMWFFPSE